MSQISFKVNGKQHYVDGKFSPDVSLNEYIRNVACLPGTKAMCHEGGCGACIVAVRASLPPSYESNIFAVNSCLVSVFSCQNWEITTVEGIGNKIIGYHDIQSRLAKFNGTQCGYCTPGWVMNMYSLYESHDKKLTMEEIENSFGSNICRCTGYRPIVDAFKSFAVDADKKLTDKIVDLEDLSIVKACGVKCKNNCRHNKENNFESWCFLNNSNEDKDMIVIDGGTHKWYKVYTLKDAFAVMGKGNYKLVAGNTGQGVYHIKDYPENIIDIFDIPNLKGYILDVNLILASGMTLTASMEVFNRLAAENGEFSYLKAFYDHLDLVAHIPVRNIGTIGGNLYMKHSNNEFPSDIFLLLETVGAMITISETGEDKKIMNLTEFLKTDMREKLILSVSLPPLSSNYALKTYKIMPRSQNAHAVVNAGFLFKFNEGLNTIKTASIVYGNVSKNFIHASKTENILIGKDLYSDKTLQLALKSLSNEIEPEDMLAEPSAEYRKMLAIALYYKAILYLCPPEKINVRYKSGGEIIKRTISKGNQTYDTDKTVWPLNQPVPKLEALVQCSGEATFANDLLKHTDELYAAFVTADALPGSIIQDFDTTDALKISGVIAFYSAKDVPGDNSFTPKNIPGMLDSEEVLCRDRVKFYGQPAGILVAVREKIAIKAAKLVKINYASVNSNNALVTISDVIDSNEKSQRIKKDRVVEPTTKGSNTSDVVNGDFSIGGQYHFYMELQTCVAEPTENGIDIYSATQWLDLTNVAVANFLNVPVNKVNVIVRRVGGGYGGKISRASQIACAASLVCHLQGKTCRFILPLQTNMQVIGKRLPTKSKFEIGVSTEGEIQYLNNVFYQDNGHSSNETVAPFTIEHFRNCYDSSRWYIESNSVLTDMPSNTYCRSPSSAEGVAMIEYMMEKIAFTLKKDSLDIRLLNIAKTNPIPELIEQLKNDADYDARRSEIDTFNSENRWRKRSLKLIPLTYEIYYMASYNSLVSIYHGDGSVSITHGGIEMGQGLNTKAAQVCAYIFGIPLEKISIKPSSSATAPNASVTGGSIGSECISLATMKACKILMERLEPIKSEMPNASWEDIITKAFLSGVDLQASYCFNNKENDIKPYSVYAVCALEVEVDILTGNIDIRRVDLLEDTGRSLSPEIDIGQIEGALVMGLGYWTSEKLIYDNTSGKLLTDRTWTYKPPGIKDIPADMRIYFRRNGSNEFGVLQSKATGEPALCLATAVTHAIREAVRSSRLEAGYEDEWLEIENPCNVENVFKASAHKIEHFKLK